MNYDEGERIKIVSLLFGAYGQANDGNRQAIYVSLLADFPNELLIKTIKKLILENKFLPAVSEIKDAAESLYHAIDDDGRIKDWDEAWSEIYKAMQSTPWGVRPKFSRIEIQEAVNCIGWNELQGVMAKDINIVRAQTRNVYEVICKRKKQQSCNAYILGMKPDGLLKPSGGMLTVSEVVKKLSNVSKI